MTHSNDESTPFQSESTPSMYPNNQVVVQVIDQAGGKTVTANLPVDATMSRLVPALVTKMRLPSNVSYGIQHMQSGRSLQPNDTLLLSHVKNNDTLRIMPDISAGGGFAIGNYRDIQLITTKLNTDPSIYPNNQVVVQVTDQAREKTIEVKLPVDATMSRLVPALVTKMRLPSNVSYVIVHMQSRRRLQPNDTLLLSHVKNNDTLMILADVLAGGGFSIGNYRDIQLITTKLNTDYIQSLHSYALYAIFLYTKADHSIAQFVRNNFEELHHMAGSSCLFYVIEQPDAKWLPLMREELIESHGPHIDQIWELLEANQFKPVFSSKAYEIAKELKVERQQIPCAIFFTNSEDNQLLIVPFSHLLGELEPDTEHNELLEMFRELFDHVEKASRETESKRLGKLKRLIGTSKSTEKKVGVLTKTTLEETVKTTIAIVLKLLIGIS